MWTFQITDPCRKGARKETTFIGAEVMELLIN